MEFVFKKMLRFVCYGKYYYQIQIKLAMCGGREEIKSHASRSCDFLIKEKAISMQNTGLQMLKIGTRLERMKQR